MKRRKRPSQRMIFGGNVIPKVLLCAYLLLLLYLFFYYFLLPKYMPQLMASLQNVLRPFGVWGWRVTFAFEGIWTIYAFYFAKKSRQWLVRKVSCDLFDACEDIFSEMRAGLYISVFLTALLVIAVPELHNSREVGLLVLSPILPLGLCLYHTLFRKTFREWPNYILTISICLEYISWAVITYPKDLILGFINGSQYVAMVSQITPYLASGTILTTLAAMIFESVKGKYDSELEKEESSDSINKNIRIKLLLHASTAHGVHGSFILQVSLAVLLYALVCGFSVLLPLMSLTPQAEISTASAQSADAQSAHSTKTEPEKSAEGVYPHVSFYFGMLGLCTGVMGVASHFAVSDESILKSEYAYVYFRAHELTERDISGQSVRWKDYCQVVANIYHNRSKMLSDDQFYHHLWEPALRHLKEQHQLCDSKFLADIVYTQQAVYGRRNAAGTASTLADSVPIAVDMLAYFYSNDGACAPAQLLGTLRYAAKQFFANQTVWEHRLRMISYTFEECVSILIYDIFSLLLCQKQTPASDCRAAAFCSERADPQNNTEAFVRRAEMLLSFPFLVRKCMQNHWEDADITIPDDIFSYYSQLVDNPPECVSDLSLLNDVHSRWISSLYALCGDDAVKILRGPVAKLHNQKQELAMKDSDYSQARRIRDAQVKAVQNPMDISPSEYFSDASQLQTVSREFVFYVFYGGEAGPVSSAALRQADRAEAVPV